MNIPMTHLSFLTSYLSWVPPARHYRYKMEGSGGMDRGGGESVCGEWGGELRYWPVTQRERGDTWNTKAGIQLLEAIVHIYIVVVILLVVATVTPH